MAGGEPSLPRRRLVRVLAATDGPTWAIMLGFFSLVGVTPLLLVPDLRRSGPLVTMAALVVIGSWVDVVVCYAVHYALVDRNGQMLDFPGDHPRVFSDYLYLAVATQAAFGTTDVTVTHPAMRRTLTRHALLAFFFNTVLVAILISLLVG
ncbi:MAG: DUF1345 domain-containing protein [Actinomycetia bacterium]|nr:DUF1345 domain-containing protein [Actinomycetes bacterium]